MPRTETRNQKQLNEERIRAGKTIYKNAIRRKGTYENITTNKIRFPARKHWKDAACYILTSNAAEVMRKHVCVADVSESEGYIALKLEIDPDNEARFHIPSTSILRPGNMKHVCNGTKPIALPIDSCHMKCHEDEDCCHLMIAIFYPRDDIIEFWDSEGRNTIADTIIEFLPGIVAAATGDRTRRPRIINLCPSKTLQKDIYIQGRRIEEAYCQTWIWFFVYMRVVLRCDMNKINDSLIKMKREKRFDLIMEFWHQLMSNQEPELTKAKLLKVCKQYM